MFPMRTEKCAQIIILEVAGLEPNGEGDERRSKTQEEVKVLWERPDKKPRFTLNSTTSGRGALFVNGIIFQQNLGVSLISP